MFPLLFCIDIFKDVYKILYTSLIYWTIWTKCNLWKKCFISLKNGPTKCIITWHTHTHYFIYSRGLYYKYNIHFNQMKQTTMCTLLFCIVSVYCKCVRANKILSILSIVYNHIARYNFFLIHIWWCENITASPCVYNSKYCWNDVFTIFCYKLNNIKSVNKWAEAKHSLSYLIMKRCVLKNSYNICVLHWSRDVVYSFHTQ